MIKKLLIVFASGLVLAIVSLSSAWLIGGEAMLVRARDGGHFIFDRDDVRRGHHAGPRSTLPLAFDGGILTLDVPASVRFKRGPRAEMKVTGPADAVGALRWEGGRLSLKDGMSDLRDLRITITGPQIAGLVLNAPGDVELKGIDQPSLRLDVRSPANVEASGRVTSLAIDTSGIGAIDLEHLEARDAQARLTGVGNIDISATGRVDADLSGAGTIALHRKPAMLNSRSSGLGVIDHDY